MQGKRYLSHSPMCAGVLVALLLAAMSAWAEDAPPVVKLSTAVGPAFALGKAGERWAKLVAERSGGKIPVRFFPGAALAHNDPAREFNALRDGAADLAVGSTLFWSAQVVELNVVSLPWLAPEANALAAIVEGPVAERLFAAVERAGVVPLALAVLGHRAMSLVGAVPRSPADFVGLKVRVAATPLLTDLSRAWGRCRRHGGRGCARRLSRGNARCAGRNARDPRRRKARHARRQAECCSGTQSRNARCSRRSRRRGTAGATKHGPSCAKLRCRRRVSCPLWRRPRTTRRRRPWEGAG
jgi:hypothetical protein